jgi:hypothetical protein
VLPAIDVDFSAIHVGRRLGTQEINGLRHFLGPAKPTHWDLFLHDLIRAGG